MNTWGIKLLVCAVALATFLFNPVSRASDWNEPVDLKEGGYRFSARIYQELAGKSTGNLFLSPASIHTALGMTYPGAKGQTASEIMQALDFKRDAGTTASQFGDLLAQLNSPRLDYEKKPSYQLSMVNALWGQNGYPFSEDYTSAMNKKFGAKFNSLDFSASEAARKTINDWVEEQTKTRIKNLIPQGTITPATRLVLTNAIYFKSAWGDDYFRESNTQKGKFYAPEKEVEADLMHTNRNFAFTEDPQCQVVSLPYKGHQLNFILILPRDKNGLAALEKSLTPEKLKTYLNPQGVMLVDLKLPRFKIESSFMLASTLKTLGMPLAFTDKADFTGMLAKPVGESFFIGEVIHKSFVELNEKGTEAAAATAVVMKAGAAFREPEKRTMTADHPFLFVIQHRDTQSILFMGRVANPVP